MGCTMIKNPAIRELLDHVVGSRFDSKPIQFKPYHRKNHGPMNKYLKSRKSSVYILPHPILRNTLLNCCRNFTKNEKKEHLIIGYGLIRGGGADINEIQHIIGGSDSIDISEDVINYIQGWLFWLPGAEVAIFHNHPKTEFSKLLGKEPRPSSQDRSTLLAMKFLNPLIMLHRLFGSTNRIKFYLYEKGNVIEIKGSSLAAILDILGNLGRNQ